MVVYIQSNQGQISTFRTEWSQPYTLYMHIYIYIYILFNKRNGLKKHFITWNEALYGSTSISVLCRNKHYFT